MSDPMFDKLMADLRAERAKKKRPWWQWLIIVVGAILFVVLVAFLRAWAIAWLWWWFAVPLNAPMLGMAHAFGLAGLISLFTSTQESIAALPRDKSEGSTSRQVVVAIGRPLMSVVVGYILHWIALG